MVPRTFEPSASKSRMVWRPSSRGARRIGGARSFIYPILSPCRPRPGIPSSTAAPMGGNQGAAAARAVPTKAGRSTRASSDDSLQDPTIGSVSPRSEYSRALSIASEGRSPASAPPSRALGG